MAGLFDFLSDDPQTMGLLGGAAGMLNASGPSLMPRSFGQVLGAGMDGMQKAREQQMARQMAGLKLKDAESDLKNQEMLRERQRKIAEELLKLGAEGATGQPAGVPAAAPMASALPGAGALSPKTGGPDWLQAYQQQQPTAATLAAPAQPDNPRAKTAERLLAEAQVYAKHGDFDAANKRYEAASKLQPKYATDFRPAMGPDGKLHNYLVAEDGTFKDAGVGAKPEMTEIALGDRKLWRDKNTISDGEAFKVGYSPGDLVSMRGQDKVDRRAADANSIAASGKVISTSSDLRKEFDTLPEVKNYKQALPAYTSIVDAAKRNTTQSDINIVYGIAKLYDPTSVVREGEYATVANSPNIPERVKGLAQYLSGGGRLTQQVKDELLAEAKSRMQSYEQPFTAARGNYETISRNSGADPKLLFPAAHQSPTAAQPKATPPQGAVNLLKLNPKLRADFDAKYGAGAAASVLGK